MSRMFYAAIASLISLLPGPGLAQSAPDAFPQKPFRIVVPFPPGGTSDILGRLIGQKLTEYWGQPAIIENRGGGGGSIGMELVRKAAPDGSTLALTNQFVVTSSVLNSNVPFDIARDFEGIALVATTPLMLIAGPAVKAANLKELTESLRSHPNKTTYASCSLGSPMHFSGELYKSLAKVSMVHVAYRGCAPAIVDVMGGQVELGLVTVGSAIQHVRSGKLRALGVTGRVRTPAAPDVPTFRESGVPGLESYELDSWYGVMAPPGTPAQIAAALTQQFMRIMEEPDVQQKLAAAGFDKLVGNGDQLMSVVKTDLDKFKKIAHSAGIKLE
jgi:tripartite-type tricarboxylate transporter receptor subunit TctC